LIEFTENTYVVMQPMDSIDTSVMYMKLVRSTDRSCISSTTQVNKWHQKQTNHKL